MEQRAGVTDVRQQTRPEAESQRRQTEEEARKMLDKEATKAIALTRQAIDAISSGKTNDAIALIEQAVGKINVLLARNPATALIPVDLDVMVIDTAPREPQEILDIAKDASFALDIGDYPGARAFLARLMSEVRVRVYKLPLETYPDALKEAARQLDKKDTEGAGSTLMTAVNTLVMVDKVSPLPFLLARAAITNAEAKGQDEKATGEALLQIAKKELMRGRDLGYAATHEYDELRDELTNLEKRFKAHEDTSGAFSRMKEKLNALLKRQGRQKAEQNQAA